MEIIRRFLFRNFCAYDHARSRPAIRMQKYKGLITRRIKFPEQLRKISFVNYKPEPQPIEDSDHAKEANGTNGHRLC